MIAKKGNYNLFNILYPLVIFTSFAIFFILFFVIKVEIKPFSYFIFVIIIIFAEGEIIKYILKKEMLFFRTHVEYSEDKVTIKFERFLYLIIDITIILLLILFIFFNDKYFRLISLIDKDKVRGGIYFSLLIGVAGSVAFWVHYFVRKWIKGTNSKKRGN